MAREPRTWLYVSGYRFLLRRVESALLRRDVGGPDLPIRAHSASLALGCALTAVAVLGCALLASLRPQPRLDDAQIVMGRESGALYVRVGDTWHPALNLASARLVAGADADPRPVPESALGHTRRGPLLGIPGAPQHIGRLLGSDAAWTICDTDRGPATTIVVGPVGDAPLRRLDPGQAALVAPAPGSPAYLLYNGRRAVVDLVDPAVVRALRLEGQRPHVVSQTLLNAIPEVPPIRVPRIGGRGPSGSRGGHGFPVGTVLRITRGDGDEFYVVLDSGVQRIGQVAADLLRFSDSRGAADVVAVAPDVIRAAAIVDALPVSTFPDRAPTTSEPSAGGAPTVCATWAPTPIGQAELAFSAGSAPPVPPGQAPVGLSQADGRGPALDAVYLPPGRSAYVRGQGPSGDAAQATTRYLVTDTGVRFALHDDEAAHDLGLQGEPVAAPWPMLAALPCGPELSRASASVARDTIAAGPR